ncbi:hypothetical protein FGO68_gene7497 [Halteria grandinella]|uniref:Uncharacterized protein n=1 Tax=Halteria grandinella TaxID=5974 RepID=A0A8J8NU69_HALGN|nr:hypothetical protein FGO68_gene7497 [Halteria grandinella]
MSKFDAVCTLIQLIANNYNKAGEFRIQSLFTAMDHQKSPSMHGSPHLLSLPSQQLKLLPTLQLKKSNNIRNGASTSMSAAPVVAPQSPQIVGIGSMSLKNIMTIKDLIKFGKELKLEKNLRATSTNLEALQQRRAYRKIIKMRSLKANDDLKGLPPPPKYERHHRHQGVSGSYNDFDSVEEQMETSIRRSSLDYPPIHETTFDEMTQEEETVNDDSSGVEIGDVQEQQETQLLEENQSPSPTQHFTKVLEVKMPTVAITKQELVEAKNEIDFSNSSMISQSTRSHQGWQRFFENPIPNGFKIPEKLTGVDRIRVIGIGRLSKNDICGTKDLKIKPVLLKPPKKAPETTIRKKKPPVKKNRLSSSLEQDKQFDVLESIKKNLNILKDTIEQESINKQTQQMGYSPIKSKLLRFKERAPKDVLEDAERLFTENLKINPAPTQSLGQMNIPRKSRPQFHQRDFEFPAYLPKNVRLQKCALALSNQPSPLYPLRKGTNGKPLEHNERLRQLCSLRVSKSELCPTFPYQPAEPREHSKHVLPSHLQINARQIHELPNDHLALVRYLHAFTAGGGQCNGGRECEDSQDQIQEAHQEKHHEHEQVI